MSSKFSSLLALLCLSFTGTISAHASIIGATYSSGSAGSLNGTSFTVSGSASTATLNLSGASYGSYALSSSQSVLALSAGNTYTITFATPVADLLVYDVFFRGGTYNFDAPSTIVAGNTSVTYSGNNLVTPGSFSTFSSGVLDFGGPISSLTFKNGSSGSVAITFGTDTSAGTPEPASMVLFVSAAGAALLLRRRLQSAA